MKTYIRIFVMAALVAAGQMAFGQSEEKTLLRTEQIAAKLGLNEEQKAQLDKQLKAAEETRKERVGKYRAMQKEMRRDAFVERQAQQERLKEILTPEQLEQLQSMKTQRGEQVRARFQNRRGERIDRAKVEQFRNRRQYLVKQRIERQIELKEKKGGN
ncbi:MAG: hypothetical protein HWE21_01865 [Cytophagia bacterium]|nr:hypothetical protein [Cytophagia bacterium]